MANKIKLPETFEEVCEMKGYDISSVLPSVSGMPEHLQKQSIALAKLLLIADCLNEGWIPNWNNSNEYKYFTWFYMDEPGFRFNDSDYDYDVAVVGGGSRLCFRTRALSDHAAKYFLNVFKDAMTT